MKLPGYYSSGEFARIAQVSVRTIRFYDQKNLLKPSFVKDSGARFYTDSDLAKLQQILLLKYLGFSLDDIREMTIGEADSHFLLHSLKLQKKLVQDRMEQLQLVETAIDNTVAAISQDLKTDWSQMLQLIHLTGMEQSLKSQYQNAGNIAARIRLHQEYSTNSQGWFPWIYEQCALDRQTKKTDFRILEIGCGNGALWTENNKQLPSGCSVVLSDVSEGMLRDARRSIGAEDSRFSFQCFDCTKIHFPDHSYDLIIANHVLFYCETIPAVCREVRRVLKPDGRFLCSTYGANHMKEITALVQRFDSRIRLSGKILYEHFGLENGAALLQESFSHIERRDYEDSIELTKTEPLLEYILSCHGNQNQYLLERYSEFRTFIEERIAQEVRIRNGFRITKEAGIFVCWG